jgi:thiol:disulfide interchange protein DsbD
MRAFPFLSFTLAALLGSAPLRAVVAADHPVKASLICETRGFTPGRTLTVALRLDQEAGWHTYWRDPGDAGLATSVDWDLPPGVKAGPLLWPKPIVFRDPGGLVGYGYRNQAVLFTEISVPAGYKGERLALKAQANWLVCKDVCIPGDGGVSLVLARLDPNPASANAPLFERLRRTLGQPPDGYKPSALPSPPPRQTRVPADQLSGFEAVPAATIPAPDPAPLPPPVAPALPGLGGMLLLAFIGGLILNLMPCVLPVLSLKALSFVEQSGQSRAAGLRHGLAFAAGVLTSFWALAALVLLLKRGGEAVGWGFQFQEPGFVLFMAGVVLAFALNLFGLFEVWLPGSAMQGLSMASGQKGLAGSFGHGLVMTLLATPCTAPFLGTALGFAFAASGPVLVAVFTTVAVGLAAPFTLLAAVPSLRSWLPKPGPWMLFFKEAMGFLLLGTLVWLLWLLGKQVGVDAQAWAIGWLVLLSLLLWLWARLGSPERGLQRRGLLLGGLALALILATAWIAPKALHPADEPRRSAAGDGWQAWAPGLAEDAVRDGRTVFVDFTADWCWTCKVNEKAVLGRDEVKAALQGAVLLRADWTRRDPAITAALQSFGRSGVPLYVVYKPGQGPHVLPELVTPGLVLAALKD